jgi:hypothetical protein
VQLPAAYSQQKVPLNRKGEHLADGECEHFETLLWVLLSRREAPHSFPI